MFWDVVFFKIQIQFIIYFLCFIMFRHFVVAIGNGNVQLFFIQY